MKGSPLNLIHWLFRGKEFWPHYKLTGWEQPFQQEIGSRKPQNQSWSHAFFQTNGYCANWVIGKYCNIIKITIHQMPPRIVRDCRNGTLCFSGTKFFSFLEYGLIARSISNMWGLKRKENCSWLKERPLLVPLRNNKKIEQIDSDQKENTGSRNHCSSVPSVHSFVHSHFHCSDEES